MTTPDVEANALPAFDASDNPTHCCPRFDPKPWEGRQLVFVDKPFVKASTTSLFHIPLNMGSVFRRTWKAIQDAQAGDGGFVVLSHEDSPWHAEHLFPVSKPVPGAEMVTLSGTFLTMVFEGPYSHVRRWCEQVERSVAESGRTLETLYFFYTTCPKCAKRYGKNYVVALAKVRS